MDHRCELDELREQLKQAKKQAQVKDQEIANMQSKMQKNEELSANAKTELSELKARNEQLEQKNKHLQ